MFEFFKKRKMKLNMSKGVIPNETVLMQHYRLRITSQFEDLLENIDDIRRKKMTPQEKYSVMLASLYMINAVSEELINSKQFFGSDKQFENLDIEAKKMLKGTVPNYIG